MFLTLSIKVDKRMATKGQLFRDEKKEIFLHQMLLFHSNGKKSSFSLST